MKNLLIVLVLIFSEFSYCQTDSQFVQSGFAKYSKEDYKGAIVDYSKAIELNPKDSYLYRVRGSSKNNLQDYLGAIADYSKAIELSPKNSVTYYFRGRAKFELKDFIGAIADYSIAIELNPKNPQDTYMLRAVAKCELKDFRGAIADCSKEIVLNPKDNYAYYFRGIAKINVGQKDSACLDWSKAGELGEADAYEMIKKYCN